LLDVYRFERFVADVKIGYWRLKISVERIITSVRVIGTKQSLHTLIKKGKALCDFLPLLRTLQLSDHFLEDIELLRRLIAW